MGPSGDVPATSRPGATPRPTADEATPRRALVIHQANIDVDEGGTEAAAATAVGGDTSGGGPEGEVTVTVDRPFIFLIRDGVSGEILFAGRVLDPTAG
jgi:serine protease inhibitor